MSAVTRVGTVIVPVGDQERALAFYRDALGFEVRIRDAAADHAALRARGVDADAALIDMGPAVPPMFTFRDPDGNRLRMVQRD